MKPTPTMRKVLRLLLLGRRLWWYSKIGPSLSGGGDEDRGAFGLLSGPTRRTVRAMLDRGLLVWAPSCSNDIGIRELVRPCRECGQGTEASDRLCLTCWGCQP